MRWIWIDRFEEFVPSEKAVAIKAVTAAEEQVHDLYPAFPIYPASLIVEGFAQTAGILVGHANEFEEKVILAKVGKAIFSRIVRPGDVLTFTATINSLTDAGASVTGTVTCGDDEVAAIDMMFSHIDQNMAGLDFPEHNFVFTSDFKKLVDGVGVSVDVSQ